MPDFFAAGSPYLGHPLLTAERSATEAEQLAAALLLPSAGAVLDVGCGFGRHTLALGALGHAAVGIDPSATMIEAAETAARETGIPGATFRVQAGQNLADAGTFDGAICMFTSLGQVGPNPSSQSSVPDNRAMLGNVARAVRQGGRLVVEVPVRDRAVAALVSEEVLGAGDNRTEVTRRFDTDTNRMVEQFRVFSEGNEALFDLSYTLFSPEELVVLLDGSGFRSLAVRSSLGELTALGQQPALNDDLIKLASEPLFMSAIAAVR